MTTDNFIYLQNRPIQTSQTGGQRYSDTYPFSIPCCMYAMHLSCNLQIQPNLELNTRPKQLVGSLQLDIVFPYPSALY